jgi:hypothetical protein
MTICRLSGRITGAVAAMAVAVGIIAVSAPDASANEATLEINNTSGFTLTLKEMNLATGPDHARFTGWASTIPPGYNGRLAHANSDWPYTVDPLLIYSIGDTGKTIRFQTGQGSPIPTIDVSCTFPDGQPAGISCVKDNAFGVNYTIHFQVGR